MVIYCGEEIEGKQVVWRISEQGERREFMWWNETGEPILLGWGQANAVACDDLACLLLNQAVGGCRAGCIVFAFNSEFVRKFGSQWALPQLLIRQWVEQFEQKAIKKAEAGE